MSGGERGNTKVRVHRLVLREDDIHECDRPLKCFLKKIKLFGLGMDGDMKCPSWVTYPVPVRHTFVADVLNTVFHLNQTKILEEDMLKKVTNLCLTDFLGEWNMRVVVARRLQDAWQIKLEHLEGKREVSSIDLRDQKLHDDNRLVRVFVDEEVVQIFHDLRTADPSPKLIIARQPTVGEISALFSSNS